MKKVRKLANPVKMTYAWLHYMKRKPFIYKWLLFSSFKDLLCDWHLLDVGGWDTEINVTSLR